MGLTRSLTLKLRVDMGYGESYGGTSQLPFFKNYYGGGFGSVRGFEKQRLGPRSTPTCVLQDPPCEGRYAIGRPTGGNVQVEFGAEVLFHEKIKFTKKEYSKRHHSGYLGQKSKEQ